MVVGRFFGGEAAKHKFGGNCPGHRGYVPEIMFQEKA